MASAPPPAGGAPPPPPGEGAEGGDIHHDIARDIGQMVEIMILDAKHNSETRVGKEIQKLKIKLGQMNEKIRLVSERLNHTEPNIGGLLKSDLQNSIAKLEEVWEGEVGALKHELWQTIQAHNHNADLLKHHKDAIDQVQNSMGDSASGGPELEQVRQQLTQVDKAMQREHAREQQIDQLIQRVALVQQRLSGGYGPGLAAAMPPFPMPGAPAAKKAQQKKTPKARAAKAGPAVLPNLRAEAPEFVPTTAG